MSALLRISFGLLFMAIAISADAQTPNWASPSGYQFSMTLTGVITIDGKESVDANDLLGAFVGEEVRGVAQLIHEPNKNRYYVFLTVFSNKASGEQISFRVYDASANAIITINEGIAFENNKSMGTISQPYNIKNNHAPTDITLSGSQLEENVALNTSILTLSTTDADTGESFVYALVSGNGDANNDVFTISGNELVVAKAINYELRNQLNIRIRSTDSKTEYVEKSFVINVNNANDAPTGLKLSKTEVAENTGVGASFGQFQVSDEDTNDSHTYALVASGSANNNDLFSISGDLLQVNGSIDFESTPNLVVDVRVTDSGGATSDERFSISVLDVNEQPSQLSISDTRIPVLTTFGTVLASLTTTDPDANETFTYQFIAGEGDKDNTAFLINGDQLLANKNFTDGTSHSIRLRSTDKSGLFLEQIFVLQVSDLLLSSTSVPENVAIGTTIGQLTTSQQTATFNYELVAGENDSDNAMFRIVGDVLQTGSALNYEEKSTFDIRIRSTAGDGFKTERFFKINIADQNDPPTSLALSQQALDENTASGIALATLSTQDEDPSDGHTYSLVESGSSTDNHLFSIDGSNLVVQGTIDFEKKTRLAVSIRVTDNAGASLDASFEITVRDVNEAPESITLSNALLDENLEAGFAIGNFSTTDQDQGDVHAYTLVSGTAAQDNGSFFIRDETLYTLTPFDFETQNTASIRVRSTDTAGNAAEQVFILTIADVVEVVSGIDLDRKLTIYPNPTTDFLKVKNGHPQRSTYEIMDAMGRSMMVGATDTPIDVRHLYAGTYILRLNEGGKVYSLRFTKQ